MDKSLHRNIVDAVASEKYLIAWVDNNGAVHYQIYGMEINKMLYLEKMISLETTKVIQNDKY